ncbi:MAG: hypothetical protein ACI31G_04060 [Bacilli bacterium]
METTDKNNIPNKSIKIQKSLLIIISFLTIEVLAFLGFTLGNSIIVYAILGLVLIIGVVIASFREIKSKEIVTYIFYLFPYLLFTFLLMFVPISNSILDNHISVADCYMFPFAFVSFSLLGYLINKNKSIKLKNIFIGIYSGLALFTFIGLVYTMIQFEPFYTITYQNGYVFYDGKLSSTTVGNMAYAFMGFDVKEVKLTYFSMFPTLLSTSVIGLFFISPKKERKLFILFSIFAALGLVTLIIMPTMLTLISDFFLLVIVVAVILIGRLKLKTKPFVIATKVIFALAVIYLLFFLILSQSSITSLDGLRNTLYNIPLLGKLFSLGRYRVIIDGIFASNKLLGFYDYEINFSNSFLFDGFYMTGLVGGILLVVALAITIYIVYYFYSKHDNLLEKSLLIAFVLTYFAYNLLNDTIKPYVYYDNYLLSYHNGPFLIVIFLIGFALYYLNDKKKSNSGQVYETSSIVDEVTIEDNKENTVLEAKENEK